MKILRSLTIFVIFVAQFLSNQHANAVELEIDMSKPMEISLPICHTSAQLNCLEDKIRILHSDGSSSDATYVSSFLPEPIQEYGNLIQRGLHTFSVHSGSATGPTKQINIAVQLSTPYKNLYPMDMRWGKLDVNIQGLGAQPTGSCDAPYLKLCSQFNIDPEDIYQVVVRTIKILSQDNQAEARNGDIIHEDFGTGDRWILTGSQTLVAYTATFEELQAIISGEAEGRAKGTMPQLTWRLHLIGPPGQSAFEATAKCGIYGATFRSENGTSAGQTYWDQSTESLKFNINAPHFDMNGDPFRGFFKARIPIAWLNCAFPGNTLAIASQIFVSIIYEDGSVQIALTYNKITKDFIYVEVPDFHYSSPTITISRLAPSVSTQAVQPKSSAAPTPNPTEAPLVSQSSKPAIKVYSICLKGKVSKKFIGAKCPSGWRVKAK